MKTKEITPENFAKFLADHGYENNCCGCSVDKITIKKPFTIVEEDEN